MAGFIDDGGMAARSTGLSSGTAAKDVKTLYKAIYLLNREPELVFQQFAQKQTNMDIPKNKGDNVEYTRYAPIEDSSDRNFSLLAEGTNPSANKYYAQTVTGVLDEYGDYVQPSSRLWLTAFDPKLGGVSKLLGVQAGKDLDLKIQHIIAQGFMGIRADGNTGYQGEVTLTGGTVTVPTFTVPTSITTGYTGVMVFTSGKNEGITRTFTYTGSTSVTFTVALPYAPTSGDTARICCTYALTTGDKVTCELIKKAVALLEENETPFFSDGYYHAVIPAGAMKLDFMNDTEYINLKHYADPKDLYRNLVGEFDNVRFHKDSYPYRHTAGTIGTYVKTAAVKMISIFGSDAFGNLKLAGVDQNFYINPPESTTTNPLAMYGTMGWKNVFCPMVLNGAWGVNIWAVPTAL